MPLTALVENCDIWHLSDIADRRDGPMNSMAVLRRDLDQLFRKVKSSCDSYRVVDTGSEAAQAYVLPSPWRSPVTEVPSSIKATIESFYERWYTTWALAIGEGGCTSCLFYTD